MTTAREIPNTQQGTDTWLAARKTGVTSTDVAALLGVSPYRTPLDVWLAKQDDTTPIPETDAMWAGRRHEPTVMAWYARDTGAVIDDNLPLLQNTDRDWMLSSLDGIAHWPDNPDPIVVEAKTTNATPWDTVPVDYLCQVQWHLAVTGLDNAVIVTMHGANRFHTYDIEADPDWQHQAITFCGDWWQQHVVDGVTPQFDTEHDRRSLLPRVWQPDPGSIVDLPAAYRDELTSAWEMKQAADARWDDARTAVMVGMEQHTEAACDGEVFATWRQRSSRPRIDTKQLKADGLYDEYTVEAPPTRTFLRKK